MESTLMLYDCDEAFDDSFDNQIDNMLRVGSERTPKTSRSFNFLLNRPFKLASDPDNELAVLCMQVNFDGKFLQGSVIYEEPSLKTLSLNFFNSEINTRSEDKDFFP